MSSYKDKKVRFSTYTSSPNSHVILKGKIRRFIKNYKIIILSIISISFLYFTLSSFANYNIDSINNYGGDYDDDIDSIDYLDDPLVNEDSLKYKFLKNYITLKKKNKNKNDFDFYSIEFYQKIKVLDILDNIINESVSTIKFNNSINPYDIISENYSSFNELPIFEQANLYYSQIFPKTNFKFKAINNQIYKDVYNIDKYLDLRFSKWEKIKSVFSDDELKSIEIDDDIFNNLIKNISSSKIEYNNIIANEINNSIVQLRFFSKFFLDSDNSLYSKVTKPEQPSIEELYDSKDEIDLSSLNELDELKRIENDYKSKSEVVTTNPRDYTSIDEISYENVNLMCNSISSKVLPFLTNYYPQFTNLNSKNEKVEFFPYGYYHIKQSFLPNSPFIKSKLIDKSNSCFIKSLQSDVKSRGIIITATDDLVPELSGLIALLRALNNDLPIEIIHNGDISPSKMRILNEIAKEPVMKLPKSYFKFKKTIKIDSKFPSQNLTFVNISKCIDFKYKQFFNGWGMKLLSLLFTAFEEVIMLDTDTVPLKNLNYFFETTNYKETGTYFFKDREANSFLYDGIMDFFKKFMTTEMDSKYLDLDLPNEQVLSNRFFKENSRHFMESGLFLINKQKHFKGILSALELQFFKLISGSVHGEKEFIWLGQQYMGNSNYRFSNTPAVAIGEITPNEDSASLGKKIATELCSTHPGHLDDDKETPLWFNSGFLNCKKPESYYKDINYARNRKLSLAELRKKYLSPLSIKQSLIPPPGEYEVKYVRSNDGISYEPNRGWIMTSECSNYLWCAYDIIGGNTKKDDVPIGKVIHYKEEDSNRWLYYGDLWVDYFLIGKGEKTKLDVGVIEDDAYDELNLDKIYDEEYAPDPFKLGGKVTADDYHDGKDFVEANKGGFAAKSGNFGIDDSIKDDAVNELLKEFEENLNNTDETVATRTDVVIDSTETAPVTTKIDLDHGDETKSNDKKAKDKSESFLDSAREDEDPEKEY
ncbi:hypothetical protein B5S33_g5515 [[Candida] boidinii]|nr:hypothetical protein B5S30_g5222 [[Candida] boidinii]OWB86801.1 hypothetical protein B5S33_g5515 [[Candida] boidinii]